MILRIYSKLRGPHYRCYHTFLVREGGDGCLGDLGGSILGPVNRKEGGLWENVRRGDYELRSRSWEEPSYESLL